MKGDIRSERENVGSKMDVPPLGGREGLFQTPGEKAVFKRIKENDTGWGLLQ